MFLRSVLLSTVIGASLIAPAFAGECPANQMRADATKPVTTAAKGVTDKVLSQIDLSAEKVALKGHLMRVRKLEIQPGGIVPWHSHEDRPAQIYVASGEIHEYASNCAVPILVAVPGHDAAGLDLQLAHAHQMAFQRHLLAGEVDLRQDLVGHALGGGSDRLGGIGAHLVCRAFAGEGGSREAEGSGGERGNGKSFQHEHLRAVGPRPERRRR